MSCLRWLAALALLVAAWPARADACSCVGPIPACQAAWQADAVFVGNVLGIEDMPPDSDRPLLSRRVRVRITEPFRGDLNGDVDVLTGRGGGDCGFDFSTGQSYLIYAYRHPRTGTLSTGICSRTRRLSAAADDLAYLRGPARTPASLGTIVGTAEQLDPRPGGGYNRSSFAGARVLATGGGTTYEATTDASGRYALSVPVGTYEIRATVPEGRYAIAGFPRVEVRDARGCAGSDIVVRWDGRVSGRVVNARGEPVPFFAIDLVTSGTLQSGYASPAHEARTDAQGRYEFVHIDPGTFHLGVNTYRRAREAVVGPRALLEGRDGLPLPIDIAPGGRTPVIDFFLPRGLEIVTLEGTVLAPDGSVQEGARVYVRLDGGGFRLLGPPAVTDKDGRFRLSVVSGYRYRLTAEAGYADRFASSGDSPPVDTSVPVSPVTLRMRPPKLP